MRNSDEQVMMEGDDDPEILDPDVFVGFLENLMCAVWEDIRAWARYGQANPTGVPFLQAKASILAQFPSFWSASRSNEPIVRALLRDISMPWWRILLPCDIVTYQQAMLIAKAARDSSLFMDLTTRAGQASELLHMPYGIGPDLDQCFDRPVYWWIGVCTKLRHAVE